MKDKYNQVEIHFILRATTDKERALSHTLFDLMKATLELHMGGNLQQSVWGLKKGDAA